MNPERLKNKTVYLIGAIDRCPDLGVGWRVDFQNELVKKYNANVYNPMEKPIDIGIESKEYRNRRKLWKEKGEYSQLTEEMQLIRHVDLRMIDKADYVIAFINTDIHMCGSYEEITIANHQKKPILILCHQGKSGIPDWLFGMLPHQWFFSSKEDLFDYLDHVHKNEVVDYNRRWLFFER